MKNRGVIGAIVLLVVLIVGVVYWYADRIVYVPGALPQQAEIRAAQWTPAVDEAVQAHGSKFSELIVLAADIAISNDHAESLPIAVDFPALAKQSSPVGLIVRLSDNPVTTDSGTLNDTANHLIQSAKQVGVTPAELILQCEGPPDRLDVLSQWLTQLRQSVGNTMSISVSIPANWIGDSNLRSVARAAGSLIVRLPIGDALTDVDKPARIGVPYRIQIPIYTDPDHPSARTDPAVIIQALSSSTASHPMLLQAVIWDQLPIANDADNWRWVCLDSVMHGIVPQPDLHVEQRYPQKDITEIDLVNIGSADATYGDVAVSWSDTDLADAQALTGFTCQNTDRRSLIFQHQHDLDSQRLSPGDRRAIGWVRLVDQATINAKLIGAGKP